MVDIQFVIGLLILDLYSALKSANEPCLYYLQSDGDSRTPSTNTTPWVKQLILSCEHKASADTLRQYNNAANRDVLFCSCIANTQRELCVCCLLLISIFLLSSRKLIWCSVGIIRHHRWHTLLVYFILTNFNEDWAVRQNRAAVHLLSFQ